MPVITTQQAKAQGAPPPPPGVSSAQQAEIDRKKSADKIMADYYAGIAAKAAARNAPPPSATVTDPNAITDPNNPASAAAQLAAQAKRDAAQTGNYSIVKNITSLGAGVKPTTPIRPAVPTQAEGLSKSVMDEYSRRLQSDKPSTGLQTVLRQGQEALAQKSKQMEGAAAADAAKSGALGQGTATGLSQSTQQGVLQEMAKNSQEGQKLVSDEKDKTLQAAATVGAQGQQIDLQRQNQAESARQFDANLNQNKEQFDANLANNKDQFEKKFGQEKSQAYLQAVSAMAASNPVLAAKLTSKLLTWDGASPLELGAFTPDEQKQIADLASKNGEIQDLLFKSQKQEADNIANDAEVQRLSQTPIEKINWNDPANISALSKMRELTVPVAAAEADSFAKENIGKLVKINGKPYTIVGADKKWIATGNNANSIVRAIKVKNAQGVIVSLGSDGVEYPANHSNG